MSTQRSPQQPQPTSQNQSSLTTGVIRLARPLQSLEEEVALQAILEEVPTVCAVLFPADNQIELRYNPGVTGERSFAQALRSAGYNLVDFGQRRSSASAMRHSAIRPYPPRS